MYIIRTRACVGLWSAPRRLIRQLSCLYTAVIFSLLLCYYILSPRSSHNRHTHCRGISPIVPTLPVHSTDHRRRTRRHHGAGARKISLALIAVATTVAAAAAVVVVTAHMCMYVCVSAQKTQVTHCLSYLSFAVARGSLDEQRDGGFSHC